jgi:hypothetical protein
MSQATKTGEDEGVAEKRAQRDLTARVAIPLERRTSIWRRLLGGRETARTASS